MKKNLLFSVTLASIFFMVSCSKSTPTPPAVTPNPNPIVGLWVGAYQVTDAAYRGTYYYAFNLFADSTIVQQGGDSNGVIWTAAGTWSLSADSAFTATVSSTDISQGSWTQRLTAKYDSSAGTLSNGAWRYISGGSSVTGTFLLKRVQ